MLSFEQSMAVASGIGYAVCMAANPEQKAHGYETVVAIKVGDDVLTTTAMDAEEWRKFRLFKKVVRQKEYGHGKVVWTLL